VNELEAQLLGGLIGYPDFLPMAVAAGVAQHWTVPAHATVFAVIAHLDAAGQPVDLVMIHDRLRQEGTLQAIGGVMALTLLWEGRAPEAEMPQRIQQFVAGTPNQLGEEP